MDRCWQNAWALALSNWIVGPGVGFCVHTAMSVRHRNRQAPRHLRPTVHSQVRSGATWPWPASRLDANSRRSRRCRQSANQQTGPFLEWDGGVEQMRPAVLMVDVDGVVVRHPDPSGWSGRIEEDLGIPRRALQARFFEPCWDDVVHGRASLRERLAPCWRKSRRMSVVIS